MKNISRNTQGRGSRRLGGPVALCLLLSAGVAQATLLTTAEQTEQQNIVNARVATWQGNHPSVAGMPMMVVVTRKGGDDLRFYAFGCKKWCSGSSCQPGSCLDSSWSVDDVFEIGSVTKTFTATLATEMDRGNVAFTAANGSSKTLSVDATMDDFWNRRTNSRPPMTIWQLMSHLSGLARNLPPQDDTRAEIYNRAFMPNATSGSGDSGNTTCWGLDTGNDTPEDCENPVSIIRYSNFAFHLLGNILGDVHHGSVNNNTYSGSYWLEALNSRILSKLGVVGYEQTAANAYPSGIPSGHKVHAYRTTGGSNPTFFDSETFDNGSAFAPPEDTSLHAGAGLWISAYDFAYWMRYSMAQFGNLPASVTNSMKDAIQYDLYGACYSAANDGTSDSQFSVTVGASTPVSSTNVVQAHRQGNAWNWDYAAYKRNGTKVVTMTKNGAVGAWRANARLTPPKYPAHDDCAITSNTGGANGLGVAIFFGGTSATDTDADDKASSMIDLIYADLLTVSSP